MATDPTGMATLRLEDAGREPWDVLVIGAGPSGAIAARQVARQGRRVLLVDRAVFPRSKVCGCCLNGAALKVLAEVGLGELPRRCGAVPLRGFRLASGYRSATIPLNQGFSLSRQRLDAELVQAAIASGANFVDGTRATVDRAESDFRKVWLKAENRQDPVLARVVIVAGGLGCRVFADRVTDDRSTASGSRVGAGAVIAASGGEIESGKIYMACHRDGYVGLVRLEDGRLDIAAALDSAAIKRAGGMGPLVGRILRASQIPVPEMVIQADWHGTARLTQRRRQIFGDRWLMVGDAAGYIEPFTGEGIAWALATGTAVVPFAIQSITSGTARSGPAWARKQRALISRRMTCCRAVSRLLRYPWLVDIAVCSLARAPSLAGPFVKLLNESFVIQRDACKHRLGSS